MPSAKGSTATTIKTTQLPPVIPEFVGNDPSNFIFPEWSDQELNAEKWEIHKAKAVGSPKSAKSPKSPKSQKSRSDDDAEDMYKDPHQYNIPPCFLVTEWKRPKDIYQNAKLVVYREGWEYSDFLNASKHLFHSEFMRSFISSMGILEYMGFTNPWSMEATGGGYVPNTEDLPWRGWHHVYSIGKAGKGQHHSPQVNNMGKYVVRLFWMGCWRKIIVDDLLPVDITDHVLLPSTEKSAAEVPVQFEDPLGKPIEQDVPIELWPFLLCKALLKIANLTWNEIDELVDFDIICALTGWLVQKVNTINSKLTDLWDMCAAYSDHFTWPVEKTETDASPKSTKSKSSKKKDKKGKGSTKHLSSVKLVLPYCLVGSFTDLRELPECSLPDFAPCWGHNFLVDQSRDIPLVKPEPRPALARWKRFRWLAWAIKHGIYVEENLDFIKCLKVVSNFKKCADDIVYNEPTNLSIDIKQSAEIIDEVVQETKSKKGKDEHDKGKHKDKTKGAKHAKVPIVAPEDPSIWGDFNMLQPYVGSLNIYIKPSLFVSNIKLSDFRDKSKPVKSAEKKAKDPSHEINLQKRYIWPNSPDVCKNEPFYIFMDSLDYKFLMLNLSQPGNMDRLLPKGDSVLNNNPYEITNDLTPIAHVVVEKFNWQTNHIGDRSLSLNTSGSKSLLIQIQPGRNFLRLWLKSELSYVINIVSDVYLSAGTQESVFEFMQNESRMLLQICFDVGSYFGKLVQSFGTLEFIEKSLLFHESYKPETKITKMQSYLLEKQLATELYKLVAMKYPENYKEVTRALRIMLLDINADYSRFPLVSRVLEDPSNEEFFGEYYGEEESIWDSFEDEKRREQAATKIQAYFKMIYVRKLLALHNEAHPKYLPTFEILKKVYKDLFNVDTRIDSVSTIMRNLLFWNKSLEDIRGHYKLYHDLQSVTHFQVLTGVIPAQINSWLPIGRYIFYVNSPEPVLAKMCLSCDVKMYYVRIFNNDTNEEVKRYSTSANVCTYESNENGYTILCYGWSGETPIINWKFFIVTIKTTQNSLILLPEKQTIQSYACDIYNPNVNNIIGKCQIFINRDSPVSFRFSCSLAEVKVRLRCVDEDGHLCGEISGEGSIVLPVADLKYELKGESVDAPVSIRKSQNRGLSSKSRTSSMKSSLSLKKKRKSSETGSIKSSNLSIKGTRKSLAVEKDKVYEPTFYVIEMYVLDDTWPLTMEEWLIVENVRKTYMVGPQLFPELFPSASKESVRKSAEVPRKSQIERKSIDGASVLEKPAWCIQTISNKPDEVRVIVDRRRQEEINSIKIKWFEDNPERYARATELRNIYLESHYILRDYGEPEIESESLASLYETWRTSREQESEYDVTHTDDPTSEIKPSTTTHSEIDTTVNALTETMQEVRTLKKPVSFTKMLPPLDYLPFAYVEEKNRFSLNSITASEMEIILNVAKLKTAEDVENDALALQAAIEDYEDRREDFDEQMEDIRWNAVNQNLLIQSWYKECRAESADMMKEAYDVREEYVDKFLGKPPEKTKNKKDKGAKGEKGKKKKGAKKKT